MSHRFIESMIHFNELLIESDEDVRRSERKALADPADHSAEFRRKRELRKSNPAKASLETNYRRQALLNKRDNDLRRVLGNIKAYHVGLNAKKAGN
jgi:hypothetical protein